MKKLFSLLTVLLCAVMLSTTVFAAEADALSIYLDYVKKSKNITSMDLSITQRISMVDDSENVDIMKQDVAAKVLITPDNKMQMEMRMVDSATLDISYAYFKDNYMYQQVGNEKYKIKMDMNDALANAASIDMNLTEDMLKDAKVEMTDDGIKITYKTNIEDLKDGQGNSMASLLDDIDLPDDVKMSFSTITSSITIGEDGMLKSGSNVFGIKISDSDISLELKVTQYLRVNSLNTVDFIKFPADLGSYQLLAA